ncbi:tetratricopeptide repeat protein [Nautilia sp.]
MKKFIFLLCFVILSALEVDVKDLEKKVAADPDDIKNRIILASYCIKRGNYEKADKYVQEVLKKDPDNDYAKKMQEKLKAFFIYDRIVKKYKNKNGALKTLYEKGEYKELIKLYGALEKLSKISGTSPANRINTARAAMWLGKYKTSLHILDTVKNKKNIDYYEIKAYDLFFLQNYISSEKYFKILYKTTGESTYAEKLIEIYLNIGDINSAQKLLFTLKRTKPQTAKKYETKIKKIRESRIETLKKNYKKKPSFENLEKLVYAIFDTSPEESVKLVKKYMMSHPEDKRAIIFIAKLLTWSGNNKEALKYLSEFRNTDNAEAKLLMGKILAWQGDFDKAVIYLSDVYEHGNDKQKYEAEKMIGYVYFWRGDKKEAKKVFTSVHKKNPNDEDVKEALMVLENNVKPLIKKYTKLLQKNPGNEEFILKLGDYHYMLGNYDKAAKYYEKYLEIHPEKTEIYKTLGDIYLKLKNYYKGYGDWEYYANKKNTPEAYLELAKRYYWNGFNKEALKVLDELLKKYPQYKPASGLKAKILKINPRFINSSTSATIDEYYNKRSSAILALGERAYFVGLYESAAEYYKEYLFLKPNDYDVREKYAFSLEHSRQYAKAAGEFYLLMWYKKTPLIEYHYAFNLQKTGKIKKAKEIYLRLLQNIPKPVPDFIKKFLNEWKKAWESMDFQRYASFYSENISQNIYWRLKKQSIFKKASFINVGIYDPVLIFEKNGIYKIRFFQVYASAPKKDKGYKTLEIKCKNKICKIIKETWKKGKYIPYSKNNSFKKYIQKNLNLIERKKTEIKFIKKPYTSLNKDIKKNGLLLAANLKTSKKEESKALDYLYLKNVEATQKNVIQQNLDKISSAEKTAQGYVWTASFTAEYYQDNQNTKMLTKKYVLKKRNLFLFYKNYTLTQTSNKKGFLYGAGIELNSFLFDVFRDKSGKKNIGWDIRYSLSRPEGFTLFFNRHNLVYSRKNVCAANFSKIKAEVTSSSKNIWWSLAYERIDDSNNALTPQLEYDIKSFSYGTVPFTAYFSGWYQFNTKQTACYYSPKKSDTNILGIKTQKNLGIFKILLKGGIGYSFFDNTYVYKIAFRTKNNNRKKFLLDLMCEYSNTSPVSKNSDYKSLECKLEASKKW